MESKDPRASRFYWDLSKVTFIKPGDTKALKQALKETKEFHDKYSKAQSCRYEHDSSFW